MWKTWCAGCLSLTCDSQAGLGLSRKGLTISWPTFMCQTGFIPTVNGQVPTECDLGGSRSPYVSQMCLPAA